LGYSHPDKLSRELTSREIAGWLAWHQLEPRGDRRSDIRMALLRGDIRAPNISGSETLASLLPDFRPPEKLKPEVEALVDDFFNNASGL